MQQSSINIERSLSGVAELIASNTFASGLGLCGGGLAMPPEVLEMTWMEVTETRISTLINEPNVL